MAKDATQRERSWFCVYNNPEDHMSELVGMSEEDICKLIATKWITENGDNSSVAVCYCLSAEGLRHLHLVLENPNKVSFDRVRAFLPGMHIEATKGTKKQAEDYIYKRGAFEEKGERILYTHVIGNIVGAQGKRNELDAIDDMIHDGKTPGQIFDALGLASMRYEKIIKSAFFRERCKSVGRARQVNIIWHLGDSGSGKSHCYEVDTRSDDEIYFITGEQLNTSGVFDNYYGQEMLFIDELKPGCVKFGKLLTMLDVYRTPISCRYCDGFQLWREVNITSVYTPEELYQKMFDSSDDSKKVDIIEQLNRINTITYHFCLDDNNIFIDNPRAYKGHKNYHEFSMPYCDFISREDIKKRALATVGGLIADGSFTQKTLDEFFADEQF